MTMHSHILSGYAVDLLSFEYAIKGLDMPLISYGYEMHPLHTPSRHCINCRLGCLHMTCLPFSSVDMVASVAWLPVSGLDTLACVKSSAL